MRDMYLWRLGEYRVRTARLSSSRLDAPPVGWTRQVLRTVMNWPIIQPQPSHPPQREPILKILLPPQSFLKPTQPNSFHSVKVIEPVSEVLAIKLRSREDPVRSIVAPAFLTRRIRNPTLRPSAKPSHFRLRIDTPPHSASG